MTSDVDIVCAGLPCTLTLSISCLKIKLIVYGHRRKLEKPSLCSWYYLFTIATSGLLFLHFDGSSFPTFTVSCSTKKGIFFLLWTVLWPVTLEGLDMVGSRWTSISVSQSIGGQSHTQVHCWPTDASRRNPCSKKFLNCVMRPRSTCRGRSTNNSVLYCILSKSQVKGHFVWQLSCNHRHTADWQNDPCKCC